VCHREYYPLGRGPEHETPERHGETRGARLPRARDAAKLGHESHGPGARRSLGRSPVQPRTHARRSAPPLVRLNCSTAGPPAAAGFGGITISDDGNTGSFAMFNVAFPAPSFQGMIQDVALGDGGAYAVPNFVTVPLAPLYAFHLAQVAPGSFSSAQCFAAP